MNIICFFIDFGVQERLGEEEEEKNVNKTFATLFNKRKIFQVLQKVFFFVRYLLCCCLNSKQKYNIEYIVFD